MHVWFLIFCLLLFFHNGRIRTTVANILKFVFFYYYYFYFPSFGRGYGLEQYSKSWIWIFCLAYQCYLCCILFRRVYNICEMFLMKCSFPIMYAYDLVCKQPEVIFHCSVYSFQFPTKHAVKLITWVYAMELHLEWKVEKNTSDRKYLIFVSFLTIVFLTDFV